MDYQTLLVRNKNRIALVKMNRPERMNALGYELRADLLACLETLARNDQSVN
jgi:enoyl-CoA hydratase